MVGRGGARRGVDGGLASAGGGSVAISVGSYTAEQGRRRGGKIERQKEEWPVEVRVRNEGERERERVYAWA